MSYGILTPVLETPRLRLRGWRAEDIEPLADFFADEDSARFVGGVCSRRDTWRRLAAIAGHWTLRGYGVWALETKDTGDFAGWCGLWCPDEFPEIEVGWSLRASFRGRGLATEAAARARDFGFAVLRLPTLVSYIAAENVPSQQVARRLGARPDGEAEIQGRSVPVWRHPAPKRTN